MGRRVGRDRDGERQRPQLRSAVDVRRIYTDTVKWSYDNNIIFCTHTDVCIICVVLSIT